MKKLNFQNLYFKFFLNIVKFNFKSFSKKLIFSNVFSLSLRYSIILIYNVSFNLSPNQVLYPLLYLLIYSSVDLYLK